MPDNPFTPTLEEHLREVAAANAELEQALGTLQAAQEAEETVDKASSMRTRIHNT